MKELKTYIDSHGFIGHHDDIPPYIEFGDSTQRTGTRMINEFIRGPGLWSLVNTMLTDTYLETPTPQYTRHWDKDFWWGQEGTMSCDNFDPWFMMAALFSKNPLVKKHLYNMVKIQWKRFGFYWNRWTIWPKKDTDKPKIPDWRNPVSLLWRHLRALELWYLYPVILVLDCLCLIPHTIVRIGVSYTSPDDTGDDLNYQLWLVFCQIKMWSPIAWLCKELYGALRAQPRQNPSTWNVRYKEGYAVHNVWKSYFGFDYSPPMYDVVLPMMKYL